ncbi:uncharacterized protein LOC124184973 [Neodiprion fabricii]|uniref:uncharacterized protein LOC124184973 n=1 Tax=Neodiprion fabricii TaxID=2872261 RepID=UPI001ED8F7EA|nr:uncharacterized protein LOC124184973 [Neodiprion fabricii]XP_046431214.1 uncharacterized protein LOC124184973 [Neodiprion fabricii]XP_046431215.1 uncharacterized protein LOC124184973 [Neodiprion fabricii]XP_046431216.1 uncharacterized protein LOC124184973 [Neodiprion fabricii]
MWNKLFILIGCAVSALATADVGLELFFNEVRSLSQLPMDKLIHMKSVFTIDQDQSQEDNVTLQTDSERSSSILPVALPLTRPHSKSVRRHDDYWQDGWSKNSKISKFFQLAITALSFFAFGGYLLTLIITAIRRNAAVAQQGNVIFLQGLQTAVKRPKRSAFQDPMENDFNTERLYEGMIMLSEGYALYN